MLRNKILLHLSIGNILCIEVHNKFRHETGEHMKWNKSIKLFLEHLFFWDSAYAL